MKKITVVAIKFAHQHVPVTRGPFEDSLKFISTQMLLQHYLGTLFYEPTANATIALRGNHRQIKEKLKFTCRMLL